MLSVKSFSLGLKKQHSKESAQLRVVNDIIMATNCGDVTLLLLLDLTAVFDTINHQILISCLETYVGIRGNALNWIRSYFQDFQKFLCSDGRIYVDLSTFILWYSTRICFSTSLFSLYMLPISQILSKYGA